MAKSKKLLKYYPVWLLTGFGTGLQWVRAYNKVDARKRFRKRFKKRTIIDIGSATPEAQVPAISKRHSI